MQTAPSRQEQRKCPCRDNTCRSSDLWRRSVWLRSSRRWLVAPRDSRTACNPDWCSPKSLRPSTYTSCTRPSRNRRAHRVTHPWYRRHQRCRSNRQPRTNRKPRPSRQHPRSPQHSWSRHCLPCPHRSLHQRSHCCRCMPERRSSTPRSTQATTASPLASFHYSHFASNRLALSKGSHLREPSNKIAKCVVLGILFAIVPSCYRGVPSSNGAALSSWASGLVLQRCARHMLRARTPRSCRARASLSCGHPVRKIAQMRLRWHDLSSSPVDTSPPRVGHLTLRRGRRGYFSRAIRKSRMRRRRGELRRGYADWPSSRKHDRPRRTAERTIRRQACSGRLGVGRVSL